MRLQPGEPAKPFEVTDILSNRISLQDYQGQKLMLSFYRYASCPLCNLRVHQLAMRQDEFKAKNLNLIAFFQSPQASIARYVGRQEAPFPIVADPARTIYRQYGVESSWFGFFIAGVTKLPHLIKASLKGFFPGKMEGKTALVPADFLIGPDLKIEVAYYGNDIGDHLPMEELDAWLHTAK
jgi:peroxiredoxin